MTPDQMIELRRKLGISVRFDSHTQTVLLFQAEITLDRLLQHLHHFDRIWCGHDFDLFFTGAPKVYIW